jgi:hypothetical protein
MVQISIRVRVEIDIFSSLIGSQGRAEDKNQIASKQDASDADMFPL